MTTRANAPNRIMNCSVSGRTAAIYVVTGLAALAGAVAPARGGNIFNINQVAKLVANDGLLGDQLGYSVAISGDTAVIGTPNDDDNGVFSGSVYVFTRDANGVWIFQAKLLADNGAALDAFGRTTAISGETIVVGADGTDGSGPSSGSAYVFVRNFDTGIWTQQAQIVARDAQVGDNFGRSVAISGDTVVVGAPFDSDNGTFSGSAYVFTRDLLDGTWIQQGPKILPNDGGAGDTFGSSVAVNGNTAIIGAPTDNDNGQGSGSTYAWIRTPDGMGGVVWTQEAKLLAFDGAASDNFGGAVDVDSGTCVVGAVFDGDNGPDSGSAYVFVRTGSEGPGPLWTQQAKLLAFDGATSDNFGFSVSINGDTLVVGAFSDQNENGVLAGSAHSYVRDANGVWTQQAKLVPDDGSVADLFGWSVAISGNTVIGGARLDDDACPGNINCNSGSAYIFDLPQLSPADLNGDGVVDGADLTLLIMQWGTAGSGDLDGNGVVNAVDLATLLVNWGA